MRRKSVIQIVVVLAAVVAVVLIVRLFQENRHKLERVPASSVARDQAQARQTSLARHLPIPGPAANFRFRHLSVGDGLSYADVRAIAQDRQGFIWFGTWLGGLNRFDGYTFRLYKHDAADPRSLGSDSVRKLHVDREGVLWVATIAGVDRYDPATDSFVHYPNRAEDAPGLAHFFYEDQLGTLWVSSEGGLSRFDRATGKFGTYGRSPKAPATFDDTNIWPVCEDKTTGLLWLGSDEGLTVLDPLSGRFSRYRNTPGDPASLSSNVVVHIFQDRTGVVWISTARGLNRFDRQSKTFIRYLHDPGNPATLSDDYVVGAYEDRAGRFWVATNNGLNTMDRARGTFTRFLHDPNDPSSLSSNVINPGAWYEDSAGTLWIGTRSTGVDRLSTSAERFNTWRHKPRDPNSPSAERILGLAAGSAGELWIGTEAGLDRYDGRRFTHYFADASDPSSLNPGPQRVIAQDSRGVVWTGTYGGGLDRLEAGRVRHFRHDPNKVDTPANDNIGSLVPDGTGGLWIGVHGKGLDYFDGGHFTHFPTRQGNPAGLADPYVLPLHLDARGMLWLASERWGLLRLDTHTRKFTAYPLDPNRPGSQAANWVQDIYSDGTSLWVASTAGLFRFDPATGRFTSHYTEKDGLASNSTVSVLGDARGNIWVGTVKGLSKLEPGADTFENYDVFDGLQGNEFSRVSRAKLRNGRLYFGGASGLSAFDPEQIVANPTPPPVVITEFELFNQPAKIRGKNSPLQQAINVSSSITLQHDQSVFRFQFAALDFTAPQKNRYAYKLDPFDQDWQYTDATRRFANYTNLDPGDYTFRVKASNNDGVWDEQGVALRVEILPPWWGTRSFRALCVAVLVALLWAGYQFRVRQLQREFRKLRDVIDTIPAMAWTALPDGSNEFVNRRWAEYTGLSAQDAARSGWTDAVHPEDLESSLDKWRASLAAGEPFEFEARFLRAGGGEYRWLLARAVPVRDARGHIVRWYGTLTDIEDRKRAEQEHKRLREMEAELAHINRVSMLGELTASIAHEVNQPLAGIVSNAGACLRWLAGSEPNLTEVRDAVRDIGRDGKRAGEVIARIRALTKRAATPKDELDLNDTVREVLALVSHELKRNGVSMQTHFADDLRPVAGDRVQLQQVLLNLIMNAIETMSSVVERPRELVITTENVEQGAVQVTVQDSGSGLEPAVAAKMFQPFFTTKSTGMGMGLSISRSIVENHGGRLWAEANDGPGTTFYFTVPNYQKQELHAGTGGH
jgi:PAS domain S-box-containing protein